MPENRYRWARHCDANGQISRFKSLKQGQKVTIYVTFDQPVHSAVQMTFIPVSIDTYMPEM